MQQADSSEQLAVTRRVGTAHRQFGVQWTPQILNTLCCPLSTAGYLLFLAPRSFNPEGDTTDCENNLMGSLGELLVNGAGFVSEATSG